jgi:hypothetical protein
MIAWLRKTPVTLFVVIQAFLCLWHLNLLSPWGDETVSLRTVQMSVPGLLHAAAQDIHPPLYYLLLHFWQELPLGLDTVVQARLLSVDFLLISTVMVDVLWARRLLSRGRIAFLTIWTVSPFLLLYSRMCRSYSLQLLVGILAAACIWNYAAPATRKLQILTALALVAALYTHYVPGIALLGAANLMLIRKRRWTELAQVDALVVVAYLPWIGGLWQSVTRWGHDPELYLITGRSTLEPLVKLGFWVLSFTIGESQPDAALLAGLVVAPILLGLLIVGLRRDRELAWIVVPCALIGFMGVARWVSYPFLPARMIFTYPLLLLLAVRGGLFHRRTGATAWIAMAALSVIGIACYFQMTGFRNKEYPLPIREIAAYIERHSAWADSAILVDSTNSDTDALDFALGGSRRRLNTGDPAAPQSIDSLLADPQVRCIWFLRNTHDVSFLRLDDRFERQIGAAMTVTVHPYERFSPLETRVMRLVGIDPPPVWFHELLEYRR